MKKMRTELMMSLISAGVLLFCSCGRDGKTAAETAVSEKNSVRQQSDGSISLVLDKAECYSDANDPSNNTAEWNVLLKKAGRFDVWLSSATRDTNDLKYGRTVMISFHEKRIEAMPACDKIVLNSKDVALPFFRADSFIGSLYLQDTGLVNVQVISDRIIPAGYKSETSTSGTDTKLLSIVLTPTVR
jgi:hypothetical protein